MNFYALQPEVAGGIGQNSIVDRSIHPPIFSKLHYEFDGWLGDDLITSFPCFIATEPLCNEIKLAELTGVGFNPVEVSKSDQFEKFHPERKIPEFLWLRIINFNHHSDFGLTPKARLVVSERALQVLKARRLNYCKISDFKAL